MKEIEIIPEGKDKIELLYELAQKFCEGLENGDSQVCDLLNNAGCYVSRKIAEENNLKIVAWLALFQTMILGVSVGKKLEEMKEILALFIKETV